MSSPDNTGDTSGSPDGNAGDARGELRWNEREWLRFLRRNHGDQLRYLRFHHHFRDNPERLDHCARRMGWDTGEWVPADENADIVPEASEEPPPPTAPYCIHNHPVFIVTRALCGHLVRAWHFYCEKPGNDVGPTLAIAFGDAVRDTEHHMVMAVNGMDTRDWSLGLAQMKLAHVSLNNAFAALDRLPAGASPLREPFLAEARLCLHDLRELALRVMNDCRFELAPPDEEAE